MIASVSIDDSAGERRPFAQLAPRIVHDVLLLSFGHLGHSRRVGDGDADVLGLVGRTIRAKHHDSCLHERHLVDLRVQGSRLLHELLEVVVPPLGIAGIARCPVLLHRQSHLRTAHHQTDAETRERGPRLESLLPKPSSVLQTGGDDRRDCTHDDGNQRANDDLFHLNSLARAASR